MTTDKPELCACPWCGGIPHKAMDDDDNFYFIACPNEATCPIHPTTIGFHLAPDKALAAWNGGKLRDELAAANIERASLYDASLELRARAEAAEARVAELEREIERGKK